jgi:molybdopterin-containing oxidoreductase family molybdopterin binding subunit
MDSNEKQQDIWVPTLCGRCYASCAIRVRVRNGVAVKIEGIPETPHGGQGGLCAKGLAGLQVLYDPNRLNVPLKRTNPEKGLFTDPQWKEISWEEALDEISKRLKEVVSKNPKRLLWQGTTLRPSYIMGNMVPILHALGDPCHYLGGGGLHCGQGAHGIAGLVHGSWSIVPDFKYCKYAIYFGANKGAGSGHSAGATIKLAADARSRGMKMTVFDPLRVGAAGKADKWVPIIPGTDGAVALAMCNVIVNDLATFDEDYLKRKTNGPYLVGEDGRYVRDENNGKPMVWDTIEEKHKTYDADIKDFALTGRYEIDGIQCEPAFQRLKEHLKKYSCEMASEVSGVPASTIRQVASEFAETASIGSTIMVEGHELPFRPVSAVIFRGGEGHENSYHTCAAVTLLNQIVGSADVPGGTLGWTPVSHGFPETNKPAMNIGTGKDGLLTVDRFGSTFGLKRPGPWPPRTPERRPNEPSLHDIFPLALHPFVYASSDQEEIWNKIEWPGKFDMLISWGTNTVMSVGNREIVADTLKRIPFIVVSELYSTELAEGFADILLPDTCYLEESDWLQGSGIAFNFPFGMDDWAYHILQPVVEPKYSRRNFVDVMYDLIHRIGKWDDLVEILNKTYDFDEKYKIKPGEKISRLELADRMLKSLFGPEHDWEWFQKHAFVSWKKKPEEAYWRWFSDCRVPIYLEHLIDMGEKTKEIAGEIGLSIPFDQYTPLISWTPCSIHRVVDPEYDMYCFSYRDILHSGSHTMEQPWLDEFSQINPYTYNLAMNMDTAKNKGLEDGDIIELESVSGRKVTGKVKVMKGIQSQAIGIAACSGHWAKGMPVAKGKGTNFNTLLEIDLKHVDPVCLNMETAVRVKVRKIK